MSVHSKTGKKWSQDLAYKNVQNLSTVDLESKEVIYYHHPYDSLMENVPLIDALHEPNWNHIKRFENVKLVHENDSETFSIDFAEDLKNTLVKYSLGLDDINVIVMDENHKRFLHSYLGKYGRDCNIIVDNYLLKEVTIPESHEAEITHKFSSLSRNYRDWRAMLYIKLLDEGVLEEYFKYSFFNIWPYQSPPKVFGVKEIVTDLEKQNFPTSKKAYRWLKQCPHELLTGENVLNKWSNITYDTILSTDFHVVIETHYDQTYYTNKNEYNKDYAPTSITEKTYKAIACKKPFVAFSTPYMLNDLRSLGFKTFAPYINESYDVETDNKKRINMIVNEITRICNLPPQEYADVLEGIKEITEYNLRKLVEKQNAQ